MYNHVQVPIISYNTKMGYIKPVWLKSKLMNKTFDELHTTKTSTAAVIRIFAYHVRVVVKN